MVGDRIREQVKSATEKVAAATSDTRRMIELVALVAIAGLGIALIGLGLSLLAIRQQVKHG